MYKRLKKIKGKRKLSAPYISGKCVIYTSTDNGRKYKINLQTLQEVSYDVKKNTSRTVIRRKTEPPVFMYHVQKKTYKPYSPEISRLCEELWISLKTPACSSLKKTKNADCDEVFNQSPASFLEYIKSLLVKDPQEKGEIVDLIFKYSKSYMGVIAVIKNVLTILKESGFIFNVNHVRMAFQLKHVELIEWLMDIAKVNVVGVKLCTKWKLNSAAVRAHLPTLKNVLSHGAIFPSKFMRGKPLVKQISVECHHNFLFRCMDEKRILIGNHIHPLALDIQKIIFAFYTNGKRLK